MENNQSKINDSTPSVPLKEKFPVGMIIILFLIGFGVLGTLFGLKKAMLQLGPFILSGIPAMMYSITVAVILGISFYGIIKRKIWARKFTIGWYLISLALVTINFISFLANKQKIVDFYKELSPATSQVFTESFVMASLLYTLIVGWILSLVIIFYLYRKRDFFKN